MMKTLTLALLLCPTVYAQTDLTGVRKIGIQTSLPVAIVDVDGLPGPGATQVVRLKTNEPGSGDFTLSYFSSEGSNGEVRRDNQVCFGYNVGGPGFVSGEPQFHPCIESRYKTSQGISQSEFYIVAGANGVTSRPFGIDLFHNDGSTQVGVFSKSFIVGSEAGMPWLQFQGNWGNVVLTGDSGISYGGTRDAFISANGSNILYKPTGGILKFWDGGGGSTSELNLFSAMSTGASTDRRIVTVGGNPKRGFGWNGSLGWEFQIDDSTWIPLIKNLRNANSIDVSTTDSAGRMLFGSRSGISSPVDGALLLTNNDGVGFSRLMFGGSGPDNMAIRTSNGRIDAVNADQSAWRPVSASEYQVAGAKVLGAQCAAIPDSIGKADNTRAINAILICLRTHGVIAP